MKKCPFCFPNVPKFLPAMRHLSQTYFNLARTLLVIPISKQLSANTLNLRQSDIWGNLCNLLVICHMIFDNSGSNSRGFSPYPAGPNFGPIPNPKKYTFFPIQRFFSQLHTIKKKWPQTSYSILLSQYSK